MPAGMLGLDAYQLTTLCAHADQERLAHQVDMRFFFRALPPHRGYVVLAGLRQILAHAAALRLDPADLEVLDRHPQLGPALARRPALVRALRSVDGFEGEIDAPREGTLAFAGPGLRTDGKPLVVAGRRVVLMTPLLEVRTDLLRAKLIETPWLGRLNHLSMVASKAARVVDAARGKPVLEFGARRTHPDAAVDAAYAAYLGGCAGSSNLAAFAAWGVPAGGTMDHFAVQAAEEPGRPVWETERAFFAAFTDAFPENATLLVDTYDLDRGIRQAVAGAGPRLGGIRIDSNVTLETVRRARRLLDDLGAVKARIFVSDQLDEQRVAELAPVVDGFGVGENIVCSPDAATGIGAVAKLVRNGAGKRTIKIAHGSDKLSLPGPLSAWRFGDHDLIGLREEPAPAGGRPLLEPIWRGRAARPLPPLPEARAYVRAQIDALPETVRAPEPQPVSPGRAAGAWPLVATDALAGELERLVAEAGL